MSIDSILNESISISARDAEIPPELLAPSTDLIAIIAAILDPQRNQPLLPPLETNSLSGTAGDDHYIVSEADDGAIVLSDTSGNEVDRVAAENFLGTVVIDLGDGNDSLTLDASVSRAIVVNGGTGDDQLTGNYFDNRLKGGEGNDTLFGGGGQDQLLGQAGDDSMDGGDGEDFVQGGTGQDALIGGTGADAIYADDTDLEINAANASIATDEDTDLVIVASDGATATTANITGLGDTDGAIIADTEAAQAYLTAHPELLINGSADFQARTLADLGTLLATQSGTELLDSLTGLAAAQGQNVTLAEHPAPTGRYRKEENAAYTGSWAGTVSLLPDSPSTYYSPAVVLYHELIHSYQDLSSSNPSCVNVFENGVEVHGAERQASGLTWMEPNGTMHPANELPFSENIFREELGLPLRTSYSGEEGEPTLSRESHDGPVDPGQA